MLNKISQLYSSYNLKRCRLTPFEDYDLYSDKKDFLDNKSILTFTDLNGSLMVLRPDITLSVIRLNLTGKFYYNEPVYRPDPDSNHFRQFQQSGIEFLGSLSSSDIHQVIEIALNCLKILANGKDYVLDIADNSTVSKILINHPNKARILDCLRNKNISGLNELGAPGELIDLLSTDRLEGWTFSDDHVRIDCSAVNNLNYYNGLVFNGYIEGLPSSVLSGGQYDGILRAMNSSIPNGMGFAIYLDRLGVDFDYD